MSAQTTFGSFLIIVLIYFCEYIDTNSDESELKEYHSESHDGDYNFRFKTKDIERNEAGFSKTGVNSYYVTGFYKFIAPDGKEYKVIYTADDRGYHPSFPKEGEPTYSGNGSIGANIIRTLGGV